MKASGRAHRLTSLLAAATAALALALPAAAATREIVVEAPAPFKALLEKNLDVERAARLPEADSLDDNEWARLVAAVPAQGRALAETEGYFRADVTVAADPGDPHRLTIRLVPNEPATVGRLTIEFDGDLARKAEAGDPQAQAIEAQVRAGWKLKPGAILRNGDWTGDKAQALQALRAQGYAAAEWTATASQVDPSTNRARLFLVADSGPRFLAGNLVVEGLERQPERTVRLLAGFDAGTPLTQQRLTDYQDRLEKTGLFDQVAVIYDPDPAQADHATITVHVHEQSLQQAQVAVGYSSTTGPRVTLEHTDRKPFGLAATTSNKLQWGRDLQQWDFSLATHPAQDFHSWILGASIGRILTTGDDVRSGFIRFGRTQDSNPLDRMTFAEFERSLACTQYGCIDARALSLNQHGVWRRLDSVILPTKGYSINAQVGVGYAGGPDSKYGPYARLYGRLTEYWPLGHDWYTQARVELGQIIVDPAVAMPDAEQWRAGGEDSVRGYAWRSLAPTDAHGDIVGGNALITTSAEIAHPFTASLPSVWWATFVDAGRAAPRFNDLKMALGYGVGVRWRSPVGPLKVDVSRGDEARRWRLDLSIGIAF
ncbi:MAG TPA: BamA/TamA family outer membrane protein [Burkholderiaceae bacterium]